MDLSRLEVAVRPTDRRPNAPLSLTRQMLKIPVPFSATTCIRCKARRQTAQACPECGLRPERHEVDFKLMARRKVIDEFREGRQPGRPGPADPKTVADQAKAAFKRVGDALRHVARTGSGAPRLTQAFADIDALVTSWPEDALLRPNRNSGRLISHLLEQFRHAMELFLEAVYDETLGAAQAHARDAQAIIDSMGLDSNNDPVKDWQSLGRKALGRADGSPLDLISLDEQLATSLSQGNPASHQAGFGLQLFVLDAIVDDLFDRVNVEDSRAAFKRALETTGPPQADLFLESAWQLEALRVGRISNSGWRTIARAIGDDPDDIEVVDSFLSLVETNREAVLRFTLGTLMTLSRETWAHWQSQSSGAIIKAADATFRDLKLGQVDSGLRHVAAHKAFDVHGDVVELRLERGGLQQFTTEEFLDRCLHTLEVTAAFQYALFDWVGTIGVEWPSSPLQRTRDREDALEFILGTVGFAVVTANLTDEFVEVSVIGERRPWGPIIAALNPIIPTSARTLSIFGHDSEMNTFTVLANLGPIRDFQDTSEDADPDEKAVRLISALQAIRADGVSEVPPDWWPGILSHAANWRVGDTVASQTRRLLVIRPLASIFRRAGLGRCDGLRITVLV